MFDTTALVFLIIISILTGCLVGLIFLYKKRDELAANSSQLNDQGYEILHQNVKLAQEILSNAETEAFKITSDTQFFQKHLEDQIESGFSKTSEQAQIVLSEDIGKAESELLEFMSAAKTNLQKAGQDYVNYLSYLKSEADTAKNQSQETIRQAINQVFVKFEEDLSSYLVSTQQQSLQSIELELRSARQLIESYKQQQLKVIDENIIAMLEETLSVVISKKLTLNDQIDLVYEALEKAKAEKFIV